MTLPATLPTALLETILTQLATLFLAGAAGDPTAAHEAARYMLAAYHPETEDELRLAAALVGFSFHAIAALGQAASPDIPITRAMRLRGGAVSLHRAAEKAERRLKELQKARREAAPRPDPEPAIAPTIEPASNTPTITTTPITNTGDITWTQPYDKRQHDLRIANSLKRAEARIAAFAAAEQSNPAPSPIHAT